jgi:hypothetical protein
VTRREESAVLGVCRKMMSRGFDLDLLQSQCYRNADWSVSCIGAL